MPVEPSLPLVPEGHAQPRQQLPRFGVVSGRGADRDVHALLIRDLVRVDLGEHPVLGQAQPVVPVAVEAGGVQPTEVADAAEYVEVKQATQAAIQAYASGLGDRPVTVVVDTADDLTCDSVYLTLTGTSAEMGDDGSVGRGNRVNGVIAPFRATSLEAACGKNPISHVGKVYNVLALVAAQDIGQRYF